ncbi:hypothetical protein ACFQ60_01115 [Streptomyces zhihengii]
MTEPFERVFGYAPRRFPDDFSAAIKGLMQRLEATFNDDRIALIESRMSQLMRQTTGVRSSSTRSATVSPPRRCWSGP